MKFSSPSDWLDPYYRKKGEVIMRRVVGIMLRLFLMLDEYLTRKRMRRSPARNLHNILWERAVQQSADFVEPYLPNVLVFDVKPDMWSYVANKQKEKFTEGICLEFGVAGGTSINWLSTRMSKFKFFGFDSFIGLKEDWIGHHAVKGTYSQQGRLPKVNKNVNLISGWFDQTLPVFLDKNKSEIEKVTLLHIDCDTYEATSAVFDLLHQLLKPGLFILFDELIGYPNWINGEYKALTEAAEKYGFKYEFRAFSPEQALVEIVAS